MGGYTEGLVTWESMTAQARFGAQCTKLAPGCNNLMISGFGPQLVAEADPGVASIVQVPTRKAGSVSGKQLFSTQADLQAAPQGGGQYGTLKSQLPCALCELLGNKMGNSYTHSMDFCFANPLYNHHIAAVLKKWMGELKTLSSKEEVP